ncbi:MAG: outer membrane protein OmpA-like peptidoglycan-associated protein, partial [Saprospiraceae bacterium]
MSTYSTTHIEYQVFSSMKSHKYFFRALMLCLCLFCIETAEAQIFKTMKAIRSLRVAQKHINNGKLEEARNELKNTIKIKNDFAVAYRELGRVHLELFEFEESVDAYEKSFAFDPSLSRAAYFECGEAYFRLSEFEMASTYFSQYGIMKEARYTNAKKESVLEDEHDSRIETRTENYLFALEAVKAPTLGLGEGPFNVGTDINSAVDDYLPTISGDGQILIYTTQQTYNPLGTATGENIFISKKIKKQWTPGESFSPYLNTEFNEGMAKFASDERFMYFAGCTRSDAIGGCDLYQARLNNLDLLEVNPLKGKVNSDGWDSQPSISCDGMVIYFSSSREGGYGGSDIWRSFRTKDGSWSFAENLGATINTAGDEESAFIAPDGVTLYFSSTGHPGMGDGDIFMTRVQQVNDTIWNWSIPYNLGYPINSPFQEVGLFVKPDGKTAYYASSRLEGSGGLDIYEFTLPEQFQPFDMVFIEGQVKDEFTEEPLRLSLDVMRNGKKWEIETDEDGWYFMCLPTQKAYAFQVNNSNYEYYMEAAFLPSQNNSIPFRFDISLIPKRRIKKVASVGPKELYYDIYFDFDNFALEDKARGQLRELVEKLETESGWEVEIIGYTDDLGNIAYNQMLSEQRAKAVVTYLDNVGIKVKSIRQEGKGAVKSGGDVEREKNRRVEI